jgi:hypothetical protein
MSAIPKHPKRLGEWVELQFMARAASYGLKLCKPWGDTARYDVVVEHPAGFHRGQVKSTSDLRRHRWECRLSYQAYTAEDFDFLAVYIVPEDMWYSIPFAAIGGKTAIALLEPWLAKGKYYQYLEAWHQLADNQLDAVCLGRDQNSVSKSRSIGPERRLPSG